MMMYLKTLSSDCPKVGYQQVGVEPDGVAERVAEWVDAERVEVEGVEAEVEAEGVADQVWAEG